MEDESIPDRSDIENDQECCLVANGEKCHRVAGNGSYNKRVQNIIDIKGLDMSVDINIPHTYICDQHKSIIHKVSNSKKWKKLDNSKTENDLPDFAILPMKSLRRYKKHFNVHTRPGLTKTQLADIVTDHFLTIPICEKETISYFIYKCKTKKSQDILYMEL
ncbi:histone deacetylase complex subunit SAP30L-A-like isoform X2 [Gordionus sp. m RMFG-2023]|uniref:histone deacetylase complex subunit SAP30L-A-like isoform X2 n=1 Tax=Gordionus sp. m RMFG-2023 TaxID=3053472 RepID=UPI0031FCFD18